MASPFGTEDDERQPGLKVHYVKRDELKPYSGNARRHSECQLEKLTSSMSAYGFVIPVLINKEKEIVAGHARVRAAAKLGLDQLPCIDVSHLTETQQRSFRIADNRIAELAEWDPDLLAEEFKGLTELKLDFSLELTGFDLDEIDIVIDHSEQRRSCSREDRPGPRLVDQPRVVRLDDLWQLGNHRVVCGDPSDPNIFERVLAGEKAQAAFCDLSNLGGMSELEFAGHLRTIFTNLVASTKAGSIHYICADWRHAEALLTAARPIYSALLNICVWDEANTGPTSLYRSMHEFIFVWKGGTAPHIDNVSRRASERRRTNVWHYAGVESCRPKPGEEQAVARSVKPAALVADAFRDCSRRGGLVLVPFSGSGTAVMAAEKTGRRAVTIEPDPLCVDATIRRWQTLTGKDATNEKTGESFPASEQRRADAAKTQRESDRCSAEAENG